jgi:hypothetical protein
MTFIRATRIVVAEMVANEMAKPIAKPSRTVDQLNENVSASEC